MLTREERLRVCAICKNRKIDLKKGLVCSLTDEHASFEGECNNYIHDQKEELKIQEKAVELEKSIRKEDWYNDIVFCGVFAYSFFTGSKNIILSTVVLIAVILSFVLSNYVLIQYEKNKGKTLNKIVRFLIKDAFALLVVFLLCIAI